MGVEVTTRQLPPLAGISIGKSVVTIKDDLSLEPSRIEFTGANAEALAAEYADLKRKAFEGIA